MKTRIIFAAMMSLMMSAMAYEPKQNGPMVNPSTIEMRDGTVPLILMGSLSPIDRSQTDPLSASVDDANLYVDFHANLGSLNITIYSAMGGMAHTETVYAQAGDGVQISLSSFASGSYRVVFSSAQGSLMGKFDI